MSTGPSPFATKGTSRFEISSMLTKGQIFSRAQVSHSSIHEACALANQVKEGGKKEEKKEALTTSVLYQSLQDGLDVKTSGNPFQLLPLYTSMPRALALQDPSLVSFVLCITIPFSLYSQAREEFISPLPSITAHK